MSTICYLADVSNPHTIKRCNFIKENYEVNLNFNDIDKIYKKIFST